MRLFRKRFFPEEIIELKDDIILWNEKNLITKWKVIRPKPYLSHGISCFFIEKGIKISKFYDLKGELLYWYCDIGECMYNKEKDEFTFIDLLADVIIYPNGEVRVVDLGEAADIFEKGKFGNENMCMMLRRLDYLMEAIHNGEICKMQELLERYENN